LHCGVTTTQQNEQQQTIVSSSDTKEEQALLVFALPLRVAMGAEMSILLYQILLPLLL
jgi:hypothetical protein